MAYKKFYVVLYDNHSFQDRTNQVIYQTGCLTTAQGFIQGNVYVFAGVGIGLLVFQVINIILAAGLAVDIYKEKKIINAQKKAEKEHKKLKNEKTSKL